MEVCACAILLTMALIVAKGIRSYRLGEAKPDG
jgi:hypothetical protein